MPNLLGATRRVIERYRLRNLEAQRTLSKAQLEKARQELEAARAEAEARDAQAAPNRWRRAVPEETKP